MKSGTTVSSGGKSTDRGQSSVIGTILLIAMVVMLAGIATASVFGLSIVQDQPSIAPQASLGTDADASSLTIEHLSGEALTTDQLTVTRRSGADFTVDWVAEGVGDEWETGESITISPNPGDTVEIIWRSVDEDDSARILEEEYSG